MIPARAGDTLFPMNDVTRILQRIETGDSRTSAELLPLVYEALRRLATQKMSHEALRQTMQATALVHEAYLRLVGSGNENPEWDHRGHFFSAAAEAMRRILVENARRKNRLKRGGDFARQELDDVPVVEADMLYGVTSLD